MTIRHADTEPTWKDWTTSNPAADDDTRLEALRQYISDVAREHSDRGNITADWANKKLRKLGVSALIRTQNAYTLRVPVLGYAELTVHAADRTQALETFRHRTSGDTLPVRDFTITADPTFTSGPEDADPSVLDPDAPTTATETLTKLREYILLAVVSGPHICEDSANYILEDFGMAPVPPRKSFKVTRPVEGTMSTTVTAFDETSAARVAEWRWSDGRSGYEVDDSTTAGAPRVVEV